MTRFLHLRFWLPLLLVVGTIVMAPLFRASQPPPQSYSLALLLSGTLAIAGYLFAVIAQPEKF